MGIFDGRDERSKSANKVMLIFSGLILIIFFVAMFGGDKIREAVTKTEESMLIFDGMAIVSVMLVCVIALLVFYIYNLVRHINYKKTVPPKFWSAWGIVKKVLAVLAIILVLFLFFNNLTKVIEDANAEAYYVEYEIDEITSNDGQKATFTYFDPETGETHEGSCTIFHDVDFLSGTSSTPIYRFRVFKSTGMWIAVERIKNV